MHAPVGPKKARKRMYGTSILQVAEHGHCKTIEHVRLRETVEETALRKERVNVKERLGRMLSNPVPGIDDWDTADERRPCRRPGHGVTDHDHIAVPAHD